MVVLLATVAALQYRWTNEASTAAEMRVGAELESSVMKWQRDLYSEFSAVCVAMQVGPDSGARDSWKDYLERYVEWRSRYLDQLGKREDATWNQIAAHIHKRQPNEYDKAVTLLIDLRDLAVRQGRVAAFHSALGELRPEHAAKESLLRRLTKAKL
jgi:hypothetical protein